MDILLEGQDCPLSCKLGPILIFTSVSTQTRGAHDTVAGDEQRQRVPTHGLTNRATGFGGTGQLCQLAVRSGFSPRNLGTSPAYPAVEIFTSWQPWFQVDRQSSAPPLNGQHQIWVEAVVLESLNWGVVSQLTSKCCCPLSTMVPNGVAIFRIRISGGSAFTDSL